MVDKLLGCDTATIGVAAAVLALLIAYLFISAPHAAGRVQSLKQCELEVSKALGQTLGAHFAGRQDMPAEVESPIIVVVDYLNTDTRKQYHDAVIDGIKTGAGERFRVMEEFLSPQEYSKSLKADYYFAPFQSRTLDEALKKYNKCVVIISLVGMPQDFFSSNVYFNVKNKKVLFGVVTDNVYLMGQELVEGKISACVVPKAGFSYTTEAPEDLTRLFDERYTLITAENVIKVYEANRRLIKVARVRR